MKRVLIVLAAVALLCASLAANAVTVFFVRTGAPVPATDWNAGKVTSVGTAYTNTLLDTVPSSQGYISPSVVSLGSTHTTGPADGAGTWAAGTTANVSFDLTPFAGFPAGCFHRYVVTGTLTGGFVSVGGIGGSTSTWTATNATIGGVPAPTIFAPHPLTGQTSLFIQDFICGVPFQIFVQHDRPLSAPFANDLTIDAFIQNLPEPGSLAMLLGAGVSGSLFMWRRRRA